MNRLRQQGGWTLMELMVTFAIMAITATIIAQALPFLQGKARDKKRIHEMAELRTAIELYKADNGVYPGNGAYFSSSDGFYNGYGGAKTVAPDDYIPGLVPTYYKALPKDPKPGSSQLPGCEGNDRNWAYFSDGTNFKVTLNCVSEVGLLNSEDPLIDPSVASCPDPIPCQECCSAWSVANNEEYVSTDPNGPLWP